MKLPLIFALCLLHFHSTVAEYAGASCDLGTHGAVYFREQDGILEGVVKVHELSAASAKYNLHIHVNPKTDEAVGPDQCDGLGKHFDPLDNKAGDLVYSGGFRSDANSKLHTETFTIPVLGLFGAEVGIVGRSLIIHNEIKKEICCTIQEEAYVIIEDHLL